MMAEARLKALPTLARFSSSHTVHFQPVGLAVWTTLYSKPLYSIDYSIPIKSEAKGGAFLSNSLWLMFLNRQSAVRKRNSQMKNGELEESGLPLSVLSSASNSTSTARVSARQRGTSRAVWFNYLPVWLLTPASSVAKNFLTRFSDSTWIQKNIGHYFSGHLSGGFAVMVERGRNFSTLEKMCLERARLAEQEMKYWLAEAEEWGRLKNATPPFADVAATQLDCFIEMGNQPLST